VLGFSHITWPLSQVTKGGAKEKLFWSESQQKAFTELKHRLCSAPVLTLPDLQQPFEIETDASDYAIGAVLTQQGHPVAYHSETLSDTVQSIPLMTKRCIPLCRPADNGSITFWGRKRSSTQTTDPCSSYRHKGSCRMIAIRKWSTYLQQFHLNIKYKKGSTNNVADCLSRPPIMALTTVLNSCGHETSDWPLLYKSEPRIRPHIPDALGGSASSRFSPPGCTVMPPGTPLCSFKRACQDDLGSALQSGHWAFRGRENGGSTAEVFLLAESSTGCREVHQILHCLHHFQTDHQEARPLYSTAYP
jgi:hypothetical protein